MQNSMENWILWIPLLPLLGAAFNLFVGRVLWRLVFGRELPRRLVHFVAVGAVVAACVVALEVVIVGLYPLYQAWHADPASAGTILEGLRQNVYTWIEVGTLRIELAFRVDTLSALMILIVTFVGSLIHIYSMGYMEHEPRYANYFGYLNLFTGAMLILVLGDNLPVMFIGWEGVGVCSYLLIGFWFNETPNANAGRKAFVVNRIGDFAFLLGMFLLFQYVGSLDFAVLRSENAMQAYLQPFWGGERLAFWAGLFLFIGACGKSAQIPLYVWLPDAMAGPTPVSALIHAATMVTAGVYMIARTSFLFASSTTAMAVVAGVGAATALFAAIMAFAQTDFKKVLAYSTVSQLGFMFVGVGVGAHVAGVFHLFTHAFFKAGLFLAAGSVMHAMSGSGDIMKMGGLRKHLPRTHKSFVVYWLAICGIFPFAGFFSKDEILAFAYAAGGSGWWVGYGELLWAVLTVAALGTAFYMSRLYFLVFSGECRADDETKAHIHESPGSMTWPLIILAIFTCFIGFLGLPHVKPFGVYLPNLLEYWLHASVVTNDFAGQFPVVAQSLGSPEVPAPGGMYLQEASIWMLMGLAFSLGGLGIYLAWRLYRNGPSAWVEKFLDSESRSKFYEVVKAKFLVDELYEVIFLRPFRWAANGLFEFVDRFVIDLIFVNGSAFVLDIFGRVARWVQNGQVQRYLAVILGGAAAVFFLTTRSSADFEYQIVGQSVRFEANVGSGPAMLAGKKIRWDLDGNGQPDLKPGVSADSASHDDDHGGGHGDHDADIYIDDLVVTIDIREVGTEVTLWYTDPIFGNTVEVVKPIETLRPPTSSLMNRRDRPVDRRPVRQAPSAAQGGTGGMQ